MSEKNDVVTVLELRTLVKVTDIEAGERSRHMVANIVVGNRPRSLTPGGKHGQETRR